MLALVLTVAAPDTELASDDLWALGVVAIEERPGPSADTAELWTSLGDDSAAVIQALENVAHRWAWRLETIDDAVMDTWRDYAIPTWIADDLVVYPAWLAPPVGSNLIAIGIEPGATFGMGDHPTTVLSLLALRGAIFPGAKVLDVGCGSGVLAIGACLFGAHHADAIDISPAAVPVTIANATRNNVGDRVNVTTTALGEISARYDIVLANILAPTLIELAGDLKRVLSESGTLVISGILADRNDHVLEALTPLRVTDRHDQGMWTAITLRW